MNNVTWLYFLVENPKKENERIVFLYGFSLPTSKKCKETEIKSEEISKNLMIVCFSTITNEILNTENSILSFNGFLKNEEKSLEIEFEEDTIQVEKEVNDIIPNSIVRSPIYTKCFYTNEFNDYYIEKDFENRPIEELLDILKVLEKMSGQKFEGVYSKKIGCYEVFKVQEWIEKYETPFILEKKEKDGINFDFYLNIKDDYIFETLTIHIIFYKSRSEEVLVDIVKNIQYAQNYFIETISKNVIGFQYWIFDKVGKVIDRRKRFFISSFVSNINVMGTTHIISKDSYSKKSSLRDKDRTVSPYTLASKSSYGNDVTADLIYKRSEKIYSRIDKYMKEDKYFKNGAWFKKNEQDKIIEFLNKVTNDGAYKLTFIDPFISSESAIEYLQFFENEQLTIKFISCWDEKISPDDSNKKQNLEVSIQELQQNLYDLKDFDLALKNAFWYNLNSKKFHDRFLYIEEVKSNRKVVFSISNSLNNMLKDYDLLILPLDGEVLKRALMYIDDLILSCSDENLLYPKKER